MHLQDTTGRTPTIRVPDLDEIWLYGRNSTDEQRKESTIDSQKDAVYRNAADQAQHIAREYIDEGRSGFTLTREQLDRMREDAAAPGCRCHTIKIYDKSRLARDSSLRRIVELELAHLGIRVEYIASQIFDDSPEGRFAEKTTDNLDEYFADKLKQSLTRGRYYDIRKGHVWWHPYGYRLSVLPGVDWPLVEIDEELRPIVREIVERVIGRESAGLIARDLNKRGIPSPGVVLARARGKPDPISRAQGVQGVVQWSQRTVWALLHNPYYAGRATFDRYGRCLPTEQKKRKNYRKKEKSSARLRPAEEWFTVEVPALMSDAEQLAAKEALASGQKRNPRNTKAQYLLRGLLRCPQCGTNLVASRDAADTPQERRFYRCRTMKQVPGTTRLTHTCRTRVGAADVEPLVVTHLAQCMANHDEMRAAFEQLRDKPDRERALWEERLRELTQEQHQLEKQRDGVYQMREMGETSAGVFNERRAAVESALGDVAGKISEAQAHLGRVRDQQTLWASIEVFCADLAQRFQQYTGPEHFAQRQRTVQALVVAIDVYPDRFAVQGVLDLLDGSVARPASTGASPRQAHQGLSWRLPYHLTLPRVDRRQLQQSLQGGDEAGYAFVLG